VVAGGLGIAAGGGGCGEREGIVEPGAGSGELPGRGVGGGVVCGCGGCAASSGGGAR
jgi:hypothetical protein